MKRQSILHFNNTSCEDDGRSLNPYSSSGIYMTVVKEDKWRILA